MPQTKYVAGENALDLTAGYIPLPAQDTFHRSGDKFRLYSGGFGSGKSVCGVREAIYTAFKFPGSTGLVSRLRMKDLELTTQRTFWEQLEAMGLNRKPYVTKWSAKLQEISFGNGSNIIFSGLDDEMKLRSMQLSWAYVDEGSEVPEQIYRALMGRIRFGRPLRMWVTTNPGASGWLRSNFIDRTLRGYHCIHAPTVENIHLPQEYIDSLLAEYPEVWRKRYLEGSWDAFEGQVFTMADPGVHLFDGGGWRPSKDHIIYEGYDFGWRNPTHVTWTAWNPNGEEPLVTFAEHSGSEMTVDRHVKVIEEIRLIHGITPDQIVSLGDPAGAQVQGLTGLSYFDEYANQGIGISPSTKEPSIRAVRIAKLLEKRMSTRDGVVPAWIFLKGSTQRTWRSITNYRYKENKSQTGEDAKEAFHKEDDHGVDALGYGIMPIPLEPEVQPKKSFGGHAVRPFSSESEEVQYDSEGSMSTMFGITC